VRSLQSHGCRLGAARRSVPRVGHNYHWQRRLYKAQWALWQDGRSGVPHHQVLQGIFRSRPLVVHRAVGSAQDAAENGEARAPWHAQDGNKEGRPYGGDRSFDALEAWVTQNLVRWRLRRARVRCVGQRLSCIPPQQGRRFLISDPPPRPRSPPPLFTFLGAARSVEVRSQREMHPGCSRQRRPFRRLYALVAA